MSILSRFFSSAKHDARSEAVILGIAVDEVTRDCPFFDRNNSKVSVETDVCIKYSVQRQLGRELHSGPFFSELAMKGHSTRTATSLPQVAAVLLPIWNDCSLKSQRNGMVNTWNLKPRHWK